MEILKQFDGGMARKEERAEERTKRSQLGQRGISVFISSFLVSESLPRDMMMVMITNKREKLQILFTKVQDSSGIFLYGASPGLFNLIVRW